MNTTAKGDAFEAQVADWVDGEIHERGGLHFRADRFRLLRKHRLYSDDRKASITFDLVVEALHEGEEEARNLLVFECKNLTRSVGVKEVETLVGQTKEIRDRHIKPVLVTRSPLQSGALAYAKTHGVAVVRWHGDDQCEWVLRRAPDVTWKAEKEEDIALRGLTDLRHVSELFARFYLAGDRYTTSESDFWEALLGTPAPRSARHRLKAGAGHPLGIPFVATTAMEAIATRALNRIDYADGQVDLKHLTRSLAPEHIITVITHEGVLCEGEEQTLGQANFDAGEIHLFQTSTELTSRVRFTWAHELAHFLLGHGEHLVRETVRMREGDEMALPSIHHRMIQQMEGQANRLGAALLMPMAILIPEVTALLEHLGIRNRGYGALYLDGQRCNVEAYRVVTSWIMSRFGVSRQSARIRLTQLGILKEGQTPTRIGQLFESRPILETMEP